MKACLTRSSCTPTPSLLRCAALGKTLGLLGQDFLERRLQTLVFKLGLAKSIHHARVLIRQRHIRRGLDTSAALPAGWLTNCGP